MVAAKRGKTARTLMREIRSHWRVEEGEGQEEEWGEDFLFVFYLFFFFSGGGRKNNRRMKIHSRGTGALGDSCVSPR